MILWSKLQFHGFITSKIGRIARTATKPDLPSGHDQWSRLNMLNKVLYSMQAALGRFPLMFALIAVLGGTAADWPDTRTTGPFVCRADFPLQDIEPLLNELSQLQIDLVHALGISPAKEIIQVYLFHDRQTYDRYMKEHFPNVPFRRAVYIKDGGPGRVFAYRSQQFDVDLRHECTHALLHASLKNIPLWLDEGLAGYFELPAEQRAWATRILAAFAGTYGWA